MGEYTEKWTVEHYREEGLSVIARLRLLKNGWIMVSGKKVIKEIDISETTAICDLQFIACETFQRDAEYWKNEPWDFAPELRILKTEWY